MAHIYALSVGVSIAGNGDTVISKAYLEERLLIRGVVGSNPKIIPHRGKALVITISGRAFCCRDVAHLNAAIPIYLLGIDNRPPKED
jgi:hypothetical protein